MEAFFLLGQGWKRASVKPWIMNPTACDPLVRGSWSHLFTIHGLCMDLLEFILRNVLVGGRRVTSFLFMDIAPSEIIFSDVGHCVLSVCLLQWTYEPWEGRNLLWLIHCCLPGARNRAWHIHYVLILGVREKEWMSEWVHRGRDRWQTLYVPRLLYLEKMRNAP